MPMPMPMAVTEASPTYPVLAFERLADPDGDWITMAVRMKLDLVGLKVGLAQWQALERQVRESLHGMPGESQRQLENFKGMLVDSLKTANVEPAGPLSAGKRELVTCWTEGAVQPDVVVQALNACSTQLDWGQLDRFGRYVVWHLASKQARAIASSANDSGGTALTQLESALAELAGP
jgi:hypothetical protein